MKTTSYIAIIAALAVAATPLTATARRSHRHSTGAALTGLAVGLGIGLLSSASVQAQPVYRYETTPVMISQPVPVYYSPPPVYAPPVYYTQPVIIQPQTTHRVIHSYPTHYPSSHRGTRGAPYYRRPASSHRGTRASQWRHHPRSSHRGSSHRGSRRR